MAVDGRDNSVLTKYLTKCERQEDFLPVFSAFSYFRGKTACTDKAEIFVRDKAKSAGNPDGCRRFLTQYHERRMLLGEYYPYHQPPYFCALKKTMIPISITVYLILRHLQ